MPITVLDAYFKVYGQFILAITGIPGCNKKKVAYELSKHFNAKLIDQFEYYKKDYSEIITISGKGVHEDIINWDADDAIDWNRFNEEVNKYASTSKIIILGFNLKPDLIKFNIDYNVYLNINKGDCIKKRIKKIESTTDLHTDDHKLLNAGLFETKMYNVTFPRNDEIIKEMKINKFVKTTGLKASVVADIIWELVKNYLVATMDTFNKEQYYEWAKTNKFE